MTKHILLEEFSTAPCGFCPDGDLIAAQIVLDHPGVIWLTHHAGFGSDSMTIPASQTIASVFTNSAPSATIDRGHYPIPIYNTPPYLTVSRQKWDSICVAHLNDPPVADISISNQYDSVSRLLVCTVNVSFLTVPATGDLRLNLFLVEDSVVGYGHGWDQTNYFNTSAGHPYYGAGNPIVGYVHHRVLRSTPTGNWGLAGVIPNTPVLGTAYTQTFNNISIPVKWKADDMFVIAFVSYYNSDPQQRPVINSNFSKLTDVTTGIPNTRMLPSVRCYPNPVSTLMMLVTENIQPNSTIRIFATDGKEVMSFQNSGRTNFIDVSALSDGLYFLEVRNGQDIFHQRIVKQR